MKKIILITGIIVILAAVAFFFLFSSPPNEGGESRVGFSLREFFPFGRGDDFTTDNDISFRPDPNQENFTQDNTRPVPRLRKLSREPVAGAIMFNTGTTSVVRFIEKGTGNVYEARSDSNLIERLTNTTIPKIVRAYWLPDGSGFIAQTLIPETEIIDTSYVKLNRRNGEIGGEILTPYVTTISKLPTDIKEIAINPNGTKIFYYTKTGNHSNWFISNPDGTNRETILSHPLTEWLPTWISTNIIFLQTKSSYLTDSYTYTLNPQTKILRKSGSQGLGMVSIPKNDNSYKIFSTGGSSPQLSLLNNETHSVTNLSAKTLAEKCVWTKQEGLFVYCAIPNTLPSGSYPDSWYKGLISTEDSIKRIDLANEIFYNLSDLSRESNEKIDVIDMKISNDDSHLIFRNKIDGYLWILRVEE